MQFQILPFSFAFGSGLEPGVPYVPYLHGSVFQLPWTVEEGRLFVLVGIRIIVN
jgi:hypothetical protein